MSVYRSIELRKNASGSYKARLTIDRGSKFCGARISLGLGTHREACALRRIFLMRCLLFHLGWFPGKRIAVKRVAGRGRREVVWDDMVCQAYAGVFRFAVTRGSRAEEETMAVCYQASGDEDIRYHRFRISGWKEQDRPGDVRILTQGLRHCATEQRQHPCRILSIELGSVSGMGLPTELPAEYMEKGEAACSGWRD